MSSGKIDAEVRRRLKAGEPLYHVDAELINSLAPDLVITQEHCNVCAVTPSDVKQAGCITARQVLALQAGSVQGIFDGIYSVGRALGRDREAVDLVAAMKNRIMAVHDAVTHRRAPSVVALEWTDPIFAMGNWGPELVEAANGRLMLGEKGQFSRAIDWQRVRDADPEWLIVAPCGFDLELRHARGHDAGSVTRLVRIGAVREGKVAWADGNKYFNRSGTTIVDTVEILAEILHGYPAGQHGKAWISDTKLQETVQIQKLHELACARLAHVSRSSHRIRRLHSRLLEDAELLLWQRMPALPISGCRAACVVRFPFACSIDFFVPCALACAPKS